MLIRRKRGTGGTGGLGARLESFGKSKALRDEESGFSFGKTSDAAKFYELEKEILAVETFPLHQSEELAKDYKWKRTKCLAQCIKEEKNMQRTIHLLAFA